MKKTPMALMTAGALAGAFALSACAPSVSDAQRSSENMSIAADNFEVNRRVVVFNGITDKYLMTIEGRCSIKDEGNQLEIMCKIGPDAYKKHFAGLSDNVSYVVEQLESVDVSVYHYRVIYKPQTILPSIEFQTNKQ